MDSGWTKVAAFSTEWLEQEDGAPQIIYDSRVANSLIRNVEKLVELEGAWVSSLRPTLQKHLRRIPARPSGTRNQPYKLSWSSGYRLLAAALPPEKRTAAMDMP